MMAQGLSPLKQVLNGLLRGSGGAVRVMKTPSGIAVFCCCFVFFVVVVT